MAACLLLHHFPRFCGFSSIYSLIMHVGVQASCDCCCRNLWVSAPGRGAECNICCLGNLCWWPLWRLLFVHPGFIGPCLGTLACQCGLSLHLEAEAKLFINVVPLALPSGYAAPCYRLKSITVCCTACRLWQVTFAAFLDQQIILAGLDRIPGADSKSIVLFL